MGFFIVQLSSQKARGWIVGGIRWIWKVNRDDRVKPATGHPDAI